jgi:glycosyltransferase involved in cell wall biosynthesis
VVTPWDDDPLRVLYVNHTSHVSGGERSLLAVLGALPPYVTAVVACPEGRLAEEVRARAVEVAPITGTDLSLRLHPIHTARGSAHLAAAAFEIRKLVASRRADVLHANSIRAGVAATLPVPRANAPALVHVRDCLPANTASRLTGELLSRRADALLFNSDYTESRFLPTMRRAKSHVLHNAVDLQRLDPARYDRRAARSRLGIVSDALLVAVIGQITPWKGQDTAIRAVAGAVAAGADVELLLVGEPKFTSSMTRLDNPAFAAELRRLVADARLEERVRFLGEREDVPEILAAVDALLVPSWEEPFGRSAAEAMAAGRPVLATSVGGTAEIIDDEVEGLLLPPHEAQAWSAALGRLAADRLLAGRMGHRARERAERQLGLGPHVAALLKTYRQVRARGPRRRWASSP